MSEISSNIGSQKHSRLVSVSTTTNEALQPLIPNTKRSQPYSTRNRSLQHNSLRPESITTALQGGFGHHKRSKDQLTILNEHIHNRRHNDPFQQKPTKLAYKQQLKNKLMNTPQAANVYYGPAAIKPLLQRRSRNIPGKTLPSIAVDAFAQKTPTKNEFSPERKQLYSKLT